MKRKKNLCDKIDYTLHNLISYKKLFFFGLMGSSYVYFTQESVWLALTVYPALFIGGFFGNNNGSFKLAMKPTGAATGSDPV